MNDKLRGQMRQYAIESGLISPEGVGEPNDEELRVQALMETISDADEVGVIEVLDQVEQSDDIAVQLDELADRAEAVEQDSDMPASVLDVSVESLHREYKTILRARGLRYAATSFEAAGSQSTRLSGLIQDARRAAGSHRNTRDLLLDYTQEGFLTQLFRNDVKKLADARVELQEVSAGLQKKVDSLKARGVVVKNEGYVKFMTRNNAQVKNLPAAISAEAAYLSKAHDGVVVGMKALQAAADKLNGGSVATAVTSLKTANIFGALGDLSTGNGDLMGNYTVSARGDESILPGLTVPQYTRKTPFKINPGAAAVSALGGGVAGFQASRIMNLIAIGGVLAGSPIAVGAALAVSKAVTVGVGVGVAASSYKNLEQSSTVKSSATAKDLQDTIQIVLGYSKFTDYALDADAIQSKLKEARKNTEGLDADQKKELNAVISALDTSLNRLVRLADVVYEQAYYTTTMLSGLVGSAVSRSKAE